ncbi:MAG: redox-sensing transcriptional repressor Rex [Lentisphaerota bacterium]
MISEKTIGRLAIYRRLLNGLLEQKTRSVHSHELAEMAKVTAAQVRRDLMSIGYTGNPAHGYEVALLLKSLRVFLDAPEPQGIALAGIGNLGQAILAHFAGRRPKLAIKAAFDVDERKTHRTLRDCACYPLREMQNVVQKMGIRLGIIAVPASAAQQVADEMIKAGVRGLVNFAPVPLRVPDSVYVDNMDITMALEKVAFFAMKRKRRNT